MRRAAPFVTVEGGEGVGKSTLLSALRARLGADGRAVTLTREPGGTPAAEDLRRILLDGPDGRWDQAEEALIAFAARRAHWRMTIAPALADGAWVLCDRFIDSTRVYQAGAAAMVERLFVDCAPEGGWTPDRTLVLDLDPAAAAARRAGRSDGGDRFDRRGPAFHAAVRAAFRAIAAADPQRCRVIDASAPPDAVLDAALDALADLRAA